MVPIEEEQNLNFFKKCSAQSNLLRCKSMVLKFFRFRIPFRKQFFSQIPFLSCNELDIMYLVFEHCILHYLMSIFVAVVTYPPRLLRVPPPSAKGDGTSTQRTYSSAYFNLQFLIFSILHLLT